MCVYTVGTFLFMEFEANYEILSLKPTGGLSVEDVVVVSYFLPEIW